MAAGGASAIHVKRRLKVRVCAARGLKPLAERDKPAEAGCEPTVLSRLKTAWFTQPEALSLRQQRHEETIKPSLDAHGASASRWLHVLLVPKTDHASQATFAGVSESASGCSGDTPDIVLQNA